MSDRQMGVQEEIAKGNAAEVARLSSLSPHFPGGAICLSAREFLWFCHGTRDDSVIGRSAPSVAK